MTRNTSLTLQDEAGKSLVAARECLFGWKATGRPTWDDARSLASLAARAEISKFEPCLPAGQLAELQQGRWFDVEGARAAIRGWGMSGASS